MDSEVFGADVRRFLRQLGVTSQREIERAVGEAVAAGRLADDARVTARATVTVAGLDLRHTVEADLRLG